MPDQEKRELRWIEKTTTLLDNAIRIPGTDLRIGLDPIIGLIPYAGEVITFSMSMLLVLTVVRHGASGKLILRLVGNILLDTTIGSIPLLGDLFDFGFKSNQRNLKLLKEYYDEGKHQGNAWGVWIAGILLFILWVIAMVMLMIWLITKLLAH